jgi:hypothetical protein
VSEWEARFVVASPRLQEMVELYQSLGLEVKVEAVEASDLPDGCDDCRAALAFFRRIYTRPGHQAQA